MMEALMAMGKPRDRSKEAFWRRMVRRQRGSGLSVRDWCEQRDLRQATFYWWRAELGRREAAGEADGRAEAVCGNAFVPVRVIPDEPTSTGGRIDIELAGGRRITVRGRVDRAVLADVLAVVTSASSVEPAFGSEAPFDLSTQARREGRSC